MKNLCKEQKKKAHRKIRQAFRGSKRIRTAVNGFADRYLTTRTWNHFASSGLCFPHLRCKVNAFFLFVQIFEEFFSICIQKASGPYIFLPYRAYISTPNFLAFSMSSAFLGSTPYLLSFGITTGVPGRILSGCPKNDWFS